MFRFGFSISPAGHQGLSWGSFGCLVLFFLLIKSYSFHWEVGDENIYLYMAWATIDHGAMPYADYFFAHPPLHLLPGILWFGCAGIGPIAIRLLPVGATIVGALFLFLLSRRSFGHFGAVATVFFYLTAFSLLRASSHWTGINLSVMWIVIGLFAFYRGRVLWSGIFLALGVGTGNYVLPAACMVGLLAWLQAPKDLKGYLIGFFSVWVAIQLLGLVLGGGEYIEAVYRYHFIKPANRGQVLNWFYNVITNNFMLTLGVLLAPFLALWEERFGLLVEKEKKQLQGKTPKQKKRRQLESITFFDRTRGWLRKKLFQNKRTGMARVGCLWTLGTFLFLAIQPKVFPFYFLLAFPGMALAAGYCMQWMFERSRSIVHSDGFSPLDYRKKSAKALAVLLLLGSISLFLRADLQRWLLPNYVRTRDVPMQWSPAPIPSFINQLVKALWWEDVARARTNYSTVTEILFHESSFFEQAQPLADYVRENSTAEQTLFGDSSTAGLVALLAGRRLARDFADTNTMRFTSGLTSPATTIQAVEQDNLRFVLVSASRRRSQSGTPVWQYGKFASFGKFRSWLNENFQIAHQVRDRTKGTFLLLEGKKSLP